MGTFFITQIIIEDLKFVKAIVMQHQSFINFLLLVKEEQAEAAGKQTFGLFFKIKESAVFVRCEKHLRNLFTHIKN